MAEPTIRAMRPEEAAAVGELLVAANQEHLVAFPPPIAAGYRAELADVAHRPEGTEVYVVEVDGAVAATVTFVPDASADTRDWPAGGAVIRFLAVAPSARGGKLGERLTLHCIDRARAGGARFVGLHTAPMMTAARGIYERLGFRRAPEHDFDPAAHYGDGDQPDDPPWGLAYVLPLPDED